jgi:hypothetical protein
VKIDFLLQFPVDFNFSFMHATSPKDCQQMAKNPFSAAGLVEVSSITASHPIFHFQFSVKLTGISGSKLKKIVCPARPSN